MMGQDNVLMYTPRNPFFFSARHLIHENLHLLFADKKWSDACDAHEINTPGLTLSHREKEKNASLMKTSWKAKKTEKLGSRTYLLAVPIIFDVFIIICWSSVRFGATAKMNGQWDFNRTVWIGVYAQSFSIPSLDVSVIPLTYDCDCQH